MDHAARAALRDNVRRLRDGDRRAARAVFQALWPPALSLARTQLSDDADAHDAAQEALIKLFAQLHAYDDDRSPLGWALALVTWECRTLRTQRRRRRIDDGAAVDDVAAGVGDRDAALDRAKDVAAVAAAFTVLDDNDQATLRAMLDGDASGSARDRKRRQRALDRLKAALFGTTARRAPHHGLSPAGDDHV